MSSSSDLLKTPLYDAHQALGARLIDFGGWEMPLQYKSGILKEHACVRERAGLFDVSHMGEVSLRGPKAMQACQELVTGNVATLDDGAALYTLMCYEDGGIVDDCIVYRRGAEDYLIIVNAANCEKDTAWIREHAQGAEIVDESDETALIAVQGPKAVGLVDSLSGDDLAGVGRFRFSMSDVAGVPCMVARTGYTGEDGFELACPADQATAVWNALLDKGQADGVEAIGLGARDTLRLEAKLMLYGNDISKDTNPYEACLGWAVKLDSGPFVGSEKLAQVKAEGPKRKLVGLILEGRGIARPGYKLLSADGSDELGTVTSGTKGPTVGKAICLGYVPTELAKAGTALSVDCRGKHIPAVVHKGPFYKRG